MDYKTKAELIASVAAKTYISKSAVETVVRAFLDEICECLESGVPVRLPEIGTFSFISRKQCTTINPRTGETVVCPPMLIPKLKFNKQLTKKINQV